MAKARPTPTCLDYHTDLGTPVLAVASGRRHRQGRQAPDRRKWDDLPTRVGGHHATQQRGALGRDAHTLTELATGVPGLKVGRLESGMVDEGPDLGAYDVPTFLRPAWRW